MPRVASAQARLRGVVAAGEPPLFDLRSSARPAQERRAAPHPPRARSAGDGRWTPGRRVGAAAPHRQARRGALPRRGRRTREQLAVLTGKLKSTPRRTTTSSTR